MPGVDKRRVYVAHKGKLSTEDYRSAFVTVDGVVRWSFWSYEEAKAFALKKTIEEAEKCPE